MRTYTQLGREQRYQLSALLEMGQNQTEIAKVIGTLKSTVNRELGRNRGQRGYRPSKLTSWLWTDGRKSNHVFKLRPGH